MVLGDQLLHLARTSRFARFGFDFQSVFSLFGQLSVSDTAPHFYRCLVGFERVLLSCFPSPHWSLASSCAQLSSRFQLLLLDGVSWCWANKNQPATHREELQVCMVSECFSAFSDQFSWLLEEVCLFWRFLPSHRSQVVAAMLGFAKQPAGRTSSTASRGSTCYRWPDFLVLAEQGAFPAFFGSISATKIHFFRVVSLTSGHFLTGRRLFDLLHLSLSKPAYLVSPVLGRFGASNSLFLLLLLLAFPFLHRQLAPPAASCIFPAAPVLS
ncbi:hypothetical protein Salat_0723900 [Sesamum alatum]|uniref:Uncharacterized protein n=1 Tax=Sesamum alatum TaxID=300844 RepID=A0AAE2CVF9_9LAMI|nr:hypothetical protein Salat_0723900 [Sesamum alatum]